MRAADRGDGPHRRIVVEQHTAAAVDLCVDEAGDKVTALQVDGIAGRRRAMQHGDDVAVFHHHAGIALEAAFGEDVPVVEDLVGHVRRSR